MTHRTSKGASVLALIAIAIVAACSTSPITATLDRPGSAHIAGDSLCPDSVLSITIVYDSTSTAHAAPNANYDQDFRVANSGAASCYTVAQAFVSPVPQPVYLRSPYQAPFGYFLVPGWSDVGATGYYTAGSSTGFGFIGMSIGSGSIKSQTKFFIHN